MNCSNYSKCSYDLTNCEKKLQFGVSQFQQNKISKDKEIDKTLHQQQSFAIEFEWDVPEPVQSFPYRHKQEQNNHISEQDLFFDFDYSYHSLSDYFAKVLPEERIITLEEEKELSKSQSASSNLQQDDTTKNSRPCCNCKNSQCLKRYCPCFHNDTFCTNCKCKGCQNKSEYIAEVERARMYVFKNCHRRKQQPREKLLQNSVSYGCNCNKTKCLQGYCECFKRGQACDKRCKCVDCKNISELKSNNFNFRVNQSSVPQDNEQQTRRAIQTKFFI